MTPEELHQSILFGKHFAGLDRPLHIPRFVSHGIVRWGFIHRHFRSWVRRWFYNPRSYRMNMFPGSVVSYLLA